MDFDAINAHYRANPPQHILDDLGVRHIKEVPRPAEYEPEPCICGKIHALESDSWYHCYQPLRHDGTEIAIFRGCKECRQILTLKLVRKHDEA